MLHGLFRGEWVTIVTQSYISDPIMQRHKMKNWSAFATIFVPKEDSRVSKVVCHDPH